MCRTCVFIAPDPCEPIDAMDLVMLIDTSFLGSTNSASQWNSTINFAHGVINAFSAVSTFRLAVIAYDTDPTVVSAYQADTVPVKAALADYYDHRVRSLVPGTAPPRSFVGRALRHLRTVIDDDDETHGHSGCASASQSILILTGKPPDDSPVAITEASFLKQKSITIFTTLVADEGIAQ